MSDYILLEWDPPLATIILNRPQQRNAISYQMWGELSQLCRELDDDGNCRAVVITGAGTKAFTAGADIKDFEGYRADSTMGRRYNSAVDGLLRTLTEMETPTISMIRGYAIGGGCELAVATDLRIASEDSKMGIPAARLGISIGHLEMQGLVNLVGKGNALYILYSGRLVDAQEALGMGLVNQVVATEDLAPTTYQLTREIAALAPLSHAINKRTLNQVLAKPRLDQLTQDEADLPLAQFDTKDYQEGYRAFLEKRRPEFRGE